jgi:hypothetical protein
MSVSWSDDLPKATISRIARATIAQLEKRIAELEAIPSEAVAGDICQEELERAAPLRFDKAAWAAWLANESADRSGPADYIPTGGAGNGA